MTFVRERSDQQDLVPMYYRRNMLLLTDRTRRYPMEKIVLDTAIKFGAGRYRQGTGILEICGEEIRRFGKKAFIISGPRAFDAVKDRLLPGLAKAGVDHVIEIYTGQCSYEQAQIYADKCKAAGCNEVVGVGGGRIMDFSKAVGEYAGCGVINIPTSISTCAPFTCMSVMYTEEGAKKDCWRYSHEIDGVYLDLDVIAHCPIRYNAAGILDAMAKRIEIQNGKPVMRLEENKFDLYSAFRIAEYIYDVLRQYGLQAIEDNRRHEVTRVLETVCFVNVAITGMVANITQSFSQSAIAHSFYDGVRTHFTKEAKGSVHGEIVAVGLFTQLYYNRLKEEKEDLRAFMKAMDMPLTLAELGIPETEENLRILEEYLIDSPYVAPDRDSLQILHEAMREMITDTH